jgi:hypothetical protein
MIRSIRVDQTDFFKWLLKPIHSFESVSPGYLEAYLYQSEFPVCLSLPENQLGLCPAIQFGLLGFVVYTSVFVTPLG